MTETGILHPLQSYQKKTFHCVLSERLDVSSRIQLTLCPFQTDFTQVSQGKQKNTIGRTIVYWYGLER